ncbi:hypothetical protein [Methanobacterium lacus]|uniref:hypothetical protein n=1 Tax=Methanobacterium lacus (strain AL-21) TaxID=877455 RepID=UPI00064F72BC|nr:hypothetical protein [Methanobacterium lacus]
MKKFGILLLVLTVLLMTSGSYAADSTLKLSDNTIGVGDEFVVTLLTTVDQRDMNGCYVPVLQVLC